MRPLEAIVFDLDGTLLDSTPDIRQGLNLMLAEKERPPLALEQVRALIGEGMMELCRRALEITGGVPPEDIYPYVKTFITYYRHVTPDPDQIYPHVREMLEMLEGKGIKIGLCTNMNESATHTILQQLDLARYFGYIAGGDTFPVHKPSPAHLTGVLDALQATHNASVFVGDGPHDIVTAFRASIPCIVVTHGRPEPVETMGDMIVIEGFVDLERAIAQAGFTLP